MQTQRWTVEIEAGDLKAGPHFAKISKRPTLHVPETLVDGKWVTGTGRWEPLTTSFVSDNVDDHKDVLAVMAWYYVRERGKVKPGTMTIRLYDAVNVLQETWTLGGCWVRNIDLGEEAYTSDPTIEWSIEWEFESAKYDPVSVKKFGGEVDN